MEKAKLSFANFSQARVCDKVLSVDLNGREGSQQINKSETF